MLMDTFTDIIAEWETLEAFRASVGVPYQRARKWRDRDSIPPAYWPKVVSACRKKGLKGVTSDVLSRMYADRQLNHAA